MKVISVLPLSPRENPNFGFFTIPVMADILGLAAGQKTIQAINLVGSKSGVIENFSKYTNSLRMLGVSTDMLWIDSEHITEFESVLVQGLEGGFLTQEMARIWLCPCGKTEILEQAESLLFSEFNATTYSVKNGILSCNVCNEPTILKESRKLMLQLPDQHLNFSAEPLYASRELAEAKSKFAGRKLSVSRERETGLYFSYGKSEYFLDPDIAWMLFVVLANRHFNCSVETLLTGNKTLKHSLIAVMVAKLFGVNVPNLILSIPYVRFGTNKETQLLELLIQRHTTSALRCLLSYIVGSKRKEFSLQQEQLYWIEHSIVIPRELYNDTQCENQTQFIHELWRTFSSQQGMNNLLAKLRGKQFSKLSTTEKLVLRGILEYE